MLNVSITFGKKVLPSTGKPLERTFLVAPPRIPGCNKYAKREMNEFCFGIAVEGYR